MKKELEQRYDILSNRLKEMERIEDMLKHKNLSGDTQFDKLKKNIGSYDLKNDLPSYTPSDQKAGLHLDNAKSYIRSGEGILSKNMKFGEATYGMALSELYEVEKELKNHKGPEEVKKAKEEIANFAEALARKIKMDVEKKDHEYSLKKDLKEDDKKELEAYQKDYRVKALKTAEEAVNYAKKLIKD